MSGKNPAVSSQARTTRLGWLTRRTPGRGGAVALLLLVSCGGTEEITQPEVAQWLRASGGGDDPAEVIECMSSFMSDQLTQDELRAWLSRDPDTMTVEDFQRLPRSVEVADRCRGTSGYR